MLIHHYNEASGAYLGTSEAIESPLEPGVWLVPAQATTTAPPASVNPFSQAWNGEGWQLAPEPESDAPSEVVTQPQPEPLPEPIDLTPAEKLARFGLTVDDLRALLEL
jgi:hypothetical protein